MSTMSELDKQLRQDHMNGLISECDFKTKMNALYGLGIDMNGKIMNANLNGELS